MTSNTAPCLLPSSPRPSDESIPPSTLPSRGAPSAPSVVLMLDVFELLLPADSQAATVSAASAHPIHRVFMASFLPSWFDVRDRKARAGL